MDELSNRGSRPAREKAAGTAAPDVVPIDNS